jgi:branched-chain amino acid transport system ATP-binding protein
VTQSGNLALRVAGLNVSYDAVHAVRDVSLQVGQTEAVAVIGSNGAGKSSLLRGIMRLAPARSGTIEFHGKPVAYTKTHRIAQSGVGFVPEGRELFAGLTVEEELLVGGRSLLRADLDRRMQEMFALFPRLQERRRQITQTLSGGEQQMVAIARTLMMGPRLLLLDEPSLGLAPVIQDIVYDTLARLHAGGLPILVVEQNAFRALKLCTRAYVLERGCITREGDSGMFLNDPAIRSAYLGQ